MTAEQAAAATAPVGAGIAAPGGLVPAVGAGPPAPAGVGGGNPNRFAGVVKNWGVNGYGFVQHANDPSDAGTVFCHFSDIADGNMLAVGAAVEFEKEFNEQRQQFHAKKVTGGFMGQQQRGNSGFGAGSFGNTGTAPVLQAGGGGVGVGVVGGGDPASRSGRARGTVLRWNESRGFGFVKADGDESGVDIFCHYAVRSREMLQQPSSSIVHCFSSLFVSFPIIFLIFLVLIPFSSVILTLLLMRAILTDDVRPHDTRLLPHPSSSLSPNRPLPMETCWSKARLSSLITSESYLSHSPNPPRLWLTEDTAGVLLLRRGCRHTTSVSSRFGTGHHADVRTF